MDYNAIVSLVYEAKKFVFSKSRLSQVENKNPYDFVTAVDLSISQFMKEELAKRFPDVGFMTEEEPSHVITDKIFILDPIDGTTNLIYDYKMSSISLAYAEGGAVKFGVVFNPFTKELFFSIQGKGSYWYSTGKGIGELLRIGVEHYEKHRLTCSTRPLKQAIVEFGASSSRKDMAAETFARGARVFERCLDLRRTCSSALAICYIAAARLDGYFEKILKPWDYAAAMLILQEAGGRFSDWDGNPLPLDREGKVVFSNKVIYEELLALVAQ
ncbi:MAG: inositol monophosphatase [Clostridia bacterium]|nr:inositol monophosphatase [Clostridia bacterium]